MIAEKDPYIKSAYNQLQLISQDDQKRLEYEAREKAIHDYNQGIYEAEQRGRLQGEQAVRESTAKNLLAIGISTEIIAQATGLSKEQIEALKN